MTNKKGHTDDLLKFNVYSERNIKIICHGEIVNSLFKERQKKLGDIKIQRSNVVDSDKRKDTIGSFIFYHLLSKFLLKITFFICYSFVMCHQRLSDIHKKGRTVLVTSQERNHYVTQGTNRLDCLGSTRQTFAEGTGNRRIG